MKFFYLIPLYLSLVQSYFDIFMSEGDLDTFLKSGSMKGYFYYTEFWHWFQSVRQIPENQKFLSDRMVIGHTYEKRPIYGYYISDDSSRIHQQQNKKNIIFITALHHAREPLTLTMVMFMTVELIKALRSNGHNRFHEFFRDNMVFFVPVVNVDSYIYINEHWKSKAGNTVLMIRKNRRISSPCNEFNGGVDLNRNYDYKFGMDDRGSSPYPCEEDYRGQYPFSEPETQAIKNYIDNHPNVISGVNIHSYGNDWIYPFNFVADKSNSLLHKKKTHFYNFYKDFEKEMKDKGYNGIFGNAALTLDYESNGEAGDWLTGAKNILNLDVELGNSNHKSDRFYPPKILIDKIIRHNWLIMRQFIYAHNITLVLKQVERNQ